MTEKEKKKKIEGIIEEWKKEADKIPIKEQSRGEAILDNGNIGEFAKLTEKYEKLLNKIKNS